MAVRRSYIETPLLAGPDEETRRVLTECHAMGRMGRPEEVADAELFMPAPKLAL